MTATAVTDLLAAQRMLAAALLGNSFQALARVATWLDPISFLEVDEDNEDEQRRALDICRDCFTDVYGEAVGALWSGQRDVETVICEGISRHMVAPVRYLEDIASGIPMVAYGIDLDELITETDTKPIVLEVAAWFGITESNCVENVRPIAKVLLASLEKLGETGTAFDMACLLGWLFNLNGNTLVSESAEDIWESGMDIPYWTRDEIEFMNAVQKEANEITDAAVRALDVLEDEDDTAWADALQANIRRVMEERKSNGQLTLQWP